MTQLTQGSLRTRHWRDTPAGTEVEFWLATDDGARRLRLAARPSVAFIPAEQREQAETILRGERGVELSALALSDFSRRPALSLYYRQYRQLLKLEKRCSLLRLQREYEGPVVRQHNANSAPNANEDVYARENEFRRARTAVGSLFF